MSPSLTGLVWKEWQSGNQIFTCVYLKTYRTDQARTFVPFKFCEHVHVPQNLHHYQMFLCFPIVFPKNFVIEEIFRPWPRCCEVLTDPCELQKATVARNKVHRGQAEPTEVMISLPEFYLQQLGERAWPWEIPGEYHTWWLIPLSKWVITPVIDVD